ncbi:MAG: hypothetical protein ACKOOL_02275 [Novosphingobium sp.]
MRLTKRAGERASEVQRATTAGWYLAVCFMVCLGGALWLGSLLGFVSIGASEGDPAAYKVAARQAARKAAEQQQLARLAAEEEARNMAEDSRRLLKAPGPKPDTAAVAPEPAPASQPSPIATSTASPQ